ncbi:AsmA family protein [Xanthobacter versatilis]|uniref:AsmA family protein n=1 Tax=Xanthobacter autotrophicus (strain ATCC BAA-1158 / Py2) TaxID=78245 RepID=UPI003729E69C
MQGILISLATAVILAIGGAFAAPFVVDWNAWRGTFETQISQALGVPVVIRGPIDAEILPAPRILLRDVTLGDVVSTGGTVKALRAELSLGALLRGDMEATGVSLDRPQIRLVIDSAGRLALPTGAQRPAALSIARFEVKDGTLDILDRASDRTQTLDGLNLKGEARSLSGPFRLDGEVEAQGARFAIRSTLGKIGDNGTGRLRLVLDGRNRPYALDLDGGLAFAGAKPKFEGRATLSRHGGEGLEAWQLSGTLKASPDAVLADSLDLALGGAQTPAQLSGSARLALGRAVGLDAVLNARSLDLDALRAATDGTPNTAKDKATADQNPAAALARFLSGVAALPSPDIASRVGLSVEQLMLGGTLVRDVRADISGSAAGWRVDNAEAQLPGKAALRLSGKPTSGPGGGGFDGTVTFSADDPAIFLRWAAPTAPRDYVAAAKGPVRITGKVNAGPTRIAVDGLDATFAASRVRGSVVAALDAGAPPKLNLKLSLDGFDLDPLVAALQTAAAAVGGGADGTLALDGRNLMLSGLPLRGLTLDAAATGGNWRLSRIVMDDLAGIRLEGAGRMENFSTTPRGEFNFALSGAKADGLVPLARLVAGEQTAQVLATLQPVAAPVKLASTVVWGEAGGRNITVAGTLGQISGDVTFARNNAGVPLRIALKADAADGARALAAFGVEGLAPRLGPAHAELSVSPLTQDEAQVRGRLTLADMTAQAEGTARLSGGSIEPSLAVRLDGGDLGRVLPQASAAVEGPVPSALAFTLARTSGIWRLDTITGSLAAAPVSGNMEFEPGPVPRIGGKLAFESLSLPRILGMFAARTGTEPAGAGAWSAARLQPAAISGYSLNLELTAARLAVMGPYVLGNGRLVLGSDGADLDVRDVAGSLGGGRAAASLRLRRQGDGVQADGRLVLEQVDATALLAPTGARAAPKGKVNLLVDLGGSGRSVLAVVQNLSGQGTLGVRDLVIDGASPAGLDQALAEAAGLSPPPDERRAAQMLDRSLARGPLRIGFVETTLGVVNGVARLSPARATADGVRVGFNGSFDLARLALDTTVDLEAPEGAGGAPGGSIVWRGPVTGPERRVSAPALTSVIAMRAIERETRRLEERQGRAAPEAPAGTAPPVAPPSAQPVAAPAQIPAPAAIAPVAPSVQPQPVQAQPAPAPAAAKPAAPAQTSAPPPAPRPAAPAPVATAPAAPAQPATSPVPQAVPAAPAQTAAPQPTPMPSSAPLPQAIERREAPPVGFGAPTASGAAGTATPAESQAQSSPSRPEARATPEAAERHTPVVRQPAPRRTERAQPEPPPRVFTPLPPETTLPPTRGFGDLPRPPGLVGAQ